MKPVSEESKKLADEILIELKLEDHLSPRPWIKLRDKIAEALEKSWQQGFADAATAEKLRRVGATIPTER